MKTTNKDYCDVLIKHNRVHDYKSYVYKTEDFDKLRKAGITPVVLDWLETFVESTLDEGAWVANLPDEPHSYINIYSYSERRINPDVYIRFYDKIKNYILLPVIK